MEGWIKLHRKLLEWEWFHDPNTLKLWIYILLHARSTDGRYKGIDVPKGSFTTTLPILSQDLKLSSQAVRTALSHLEESGNITCTSTNKYRLITVEKWGNYQVENVQANRQINRQSTDKQQTSNSQATDKQQLSKNKRNKEYNNIIINHARAREGLLDEEKRPLAGGSELPYPNAKTPQEHMQNALWRNQCMQEQKKKEEGNG